MGDMNTIYSARPLAVLADQVGESVSGNRKGTGEMFGLSRKGGDQLKEAALENTIRNGSGKTAGTSEDTSAHRMDGKERQTMYEALEDSLSSHGLKLKFNIDEKTDVMQVEVLDSKSGKTVRKLPPDDLLRLSASIKELSRGLLDRSF